MAAEVPLLVARAAWLRLMIPQLTSGGFVELAARYGVELGRLEGRSRTANCILDRDHDGRCDPGPTAPCGPECNGTWPHRPGKPARPFHIKGCPATLSSLATAGLDQHSPAHGVCVDCMGRWPCSDARRYTEILGAL